MAVLSAETAFERWPRGKLASLQLQHVQKQLMYYPMKARCKDISKLSEWLISDLEANQKPKSPSALEVKHGKWRIYQHLLFRRCCSERNVGGACLKESVAKAKQGAMALKTRSSYITDLKSCWSSKKWKLKSKSYKVWQLSGESSCWWIDMDFRFRPSKTKLLRGL